MPEQRLQRTREAYVKRDADAWAHTSVGWCSHHGFYAAKVDNCPKCATGWNDVDRGEH